MFKDLLWKFRLFRARKAKAARWAIYSAVSIGVGFMLVATGNAHASFAQDSHELSRKLTRTTPSRHVIVGKASWYGQAAAGRKTATGEKLDPRELTAASTIVPLQSRALVTNLENGRSVRVRINDCGPYTKGRTLDVSKRAA